MNNLAAVVRGYVIDASRHLDIDSIVYRRCSADL